jgi:hypothetical protein
MCKVCFYVMRKDTGFAPNPFDGWCTLLGCAPNYANAKLVAGDYIAGFFRSGRPPRLVYIMEVSETFDYNDYYQDRRFEHKKPRRDRTWRERAGNNIYFRDSSGGYAQDRNACYHTRAAKIVQDLKHPVVFAGRNFAYFGAMAETANALLLPTRFHWCLPQRAVKYLVDDCQDFDPFVTWAFSHGSGMVGLPRDRELDGLVRRGQCVPVLCDDEVHPAVDDCPGG